MKAQTKGFNKVFLFLAIAVIVVGLVVALIMIPTTAKAKKVEEQLDLGAKYLSELDYEQAIAAYEAVVKIDPKCEEAYLALADIYIVMGAFDKAEEILKRAEEEIGTVAQEVEKKQEEVKEEKKKSEQKADPTPTSTPTPTEEPTSTPTPTEEPTSTPTPTNTPSPTPTSTPSPTPTNTPSPTPTNTPSPTPTNTPSLTPTSTPTPTNTPTPSPAPVAHTIYDGTTVELSKAKVGDVVLFGSYEQDNITSNGAEAIPWYVLDKDGDELLLMSVYLLDAVPYHEEDTSITWDGCTLRQWMNNDFYNRAFDGKERQYILTSYLKNEDNPSFGTGGGNDTADKVFVLSLGEVERYFGVAEDNCSVWVVATPELAVAKVTAYADVRGAYVSETESTAGNGWWWLRSPGSDDGISAAYVDRDGDVSLIGRIVVTSPCAARPALWLNLNP